MRYLATYCCLGILLGSAYGCQPRVKNDFISVTPLPQPYDSSLNWAHYIFAVKIENGELKTTPAEQPSTIVIHQTPAGKFVGFDRGEWGGALYYQPKDSSVKSIFVNGKPTPVSEDSTLNYYLERNSRAQMTHLAKLDIKGMNNNVQSVFNWKDSIFVLSGLAHGSLSYGTLYRLKAKGDSIIAQKYLDFDDAPMAYTIFNDKMYLATFERFYIVHSGHKGLILDKLFWQGLYPNSVAVKNENEVYIGLRGGYAQLDPVKKKLTFYRYDK